MRRDWNRLAAEPFDLLVVGGGVHGLATAWDASLRGLRVALVEKGDFGGATSAASLKTVHGGLRYLQHLDFGRMRDSIGERSALMRMAPHLIDPLPFLVPTYGWGMKGKPILRTALWLNDLLSCDRNRGLRELGLEIPPGRGLSRDECLRMAPLLPAEGLTGGVLFHDGILRNADRLTLAFALAAAAEGAVLVNYAAVTGWLRDGSTICGACVRDAETGDEIEVRARLSVNLAGPWSDLLVGLAAGKPAQRSVRLSKGIQLVLPPITERVAVAVTSRHTDPDAKLSRGGRHYFLLPWRGVTLAGTTDELYEDDPDRFTVSEKDVERFLAELNDALPGLALARRDVAWAFGGLRPVDENNLNRGAQTLRRHQVMDHRRDLGLDGLITVIGVKYTTCRLLAEKAVDACVERLGGKLGACSTASRALPGGDTGPVDALVRRAVEDARGVLAPAEAEGLARTYGAGYPDVLRLARENADLAAAVPDGDGVVAAQVAHAVRAEAALHLEDVVMRRTPLGTRGDPGDAALQASAACMGRELGWSAERQADEIRRLRARYFTLA